jgi:hypothetical protein
MAQRKSFTETPTAPLTEKSKTSAKPPKLLVGPDAHQLQARIKELEEGVKFISDRLRWGGDWIARQKCEALLNATIRLSSSGETPQQ